MKDINSALYQSKKVIDYINELAGRLEIVFLPPDAPDLTPDELV